ncbi:hypothetical protein H5410_061636, partial [Solanum commersonii]
MGLGLTLSAEPHVGSLLRPSEEKWRRPTSNLGKMKSFSLQVSHKTLSKLERKISKKYYSIVNNIKMCLPSASSRSGPLGGIVLLRETIRRSTDYSSHRLLDPLPSGASHTGTKGGVSSFSESPK